MAGLLCWIIEGELVPVDLPPGLSRLRAYLGSQPGLQTPFLGDEHLMAIWLHGIQCHLTFVGFLSDSPNEATFFILFETCLTIYFILLQAFWTLLSVFWSYDCEMEVSWMSCMWSCWARPECPFIWFTPTTYHAYHVSPISNHFVCFQIKLTLSNIKNSIFLRCWEVVVQCFYQPLVTDFT